MEKDMHTVLDLLTLTATGYIIFLMLTKCKSSWQADKDTLLEVYIVRSHPAAPNIVMLCLNRLQNRNT
jgi:hypothetical protein